jgi:hypothetical protein
LPRCSCLEAPSLANPNLHAPPTTAAADDRQQPSPSVVGAEYSPGGKLATKGLDPTLFRTVQPAAGKADAGRIATGLATAVAAAAAAKVKATAPP